MGLKVGFDCSIQPGLIVDHSHCWLIEIGNRVTLAPQVYLLAHDASTKLDLDYTKSGKVVIEDDVFIGARSIIMPGVTVGKGAVVAAGSVVTKDVKKGAVVGGNPAKFIMNKEDLLTKHRVKMKTAILYDESWTIHHGIASKMKKQMFSELDEHNGYVI